MTIEIGSIETDQVTTGVPDHHQETIIDKGLQTDIDAENVLLHILIAIVHTLIDKEDVVELFIT